MSTSTTASCIVQLVPTTNADTAAVYTVQFTSLGVTEFTETWAVPRQHTSFAGARRAAAPWIGQRIGARGNHHHHHRRRHRTAERAQCSAARRHRLWHLPIRGYRRHRRHRCGRRQPVRLPARRWDLRPVRQRSGPPLSSTPRFPPEPSTVPTPHLLWPTCRIHPPAWPCFGTGCCWRRVAITRCPANAITFRPAPCLSPATS